jgi:hypothetical protein
MTNAEVEKAFGVENLPAPWAVAPNQPSPGNFYILSGLAMLGLLCIIAVFSVMFGGFEAPVTTQTLTLQPSGNPNNPQTVFSQPFDLKGNRNVRISVSAPVNNSAADLDVDLVNEQNNQVESVAIPISYYQGVEDGESWTEGSKETDVTLSSLSGGKYVLRVEGTLENVQQPLPVTVKVEQNVVRGVNFCFAFVLLSILPILSLVRKWMFESRRWSESMFGGSSNTGGSSEEE